jgi:hypothetical protein
VALLQQISMICRKTTSEAERRKLHRCIRCRHYLLIYPIVGPGYLCGSSLRHLRYSHESCLPTWNAQ